ncbi:MAG: flagellar motor protein [Planctomycetes bacterium]|nr:flagellar motor protein [Planctomycetota bacterium]
MDILTILGILLGLGAVVGGQVLEGGHISALCVPTAAIIVLGGTIGAVFVSFPMSDVKGAVGGLPGIFKEGGHDPTHMIQYLVECAKKARKDGMLALEEEMRKAPDEFGRKAFGMVVDGVDPKIVRECLETEIDVDEEVGHGYAKVFESAGGFAPTIGILGAVLGLIHVMENLSDPSKLGGGIAVAFVATVYGVASANLIFLPIANKMKLKHKDHLITKRMYVEGIASIQAGDHPNIVEQKLGSLLVKEKKAESRPGQKAD